MPQSHVSIHCPHCGLHTAVSPAPLCVYELARYDMKVTPLPDLPSPPMYSQAGVRWWMGKCNACQRPILVAEDGIWILPPPQPGPVDNAIPEPMKSDLQEAKSCLAVSAWNASVVMARRALQTAAIELGAPKGMKLWEQIKHLADNHLITAPQKDWCDAARWVGNHGAHDTEPDVKGGVIAITNVDKVDAEDTIKLVELLFQTLYVAGNTAKEQLSKRGKLKP